MKELYTTCRVEWLKIKGLGLVPAAIAIGFALPLLWFCMLLYNRSNTLFPFPSVNVFEDFILQFIRAFSGFFLQLFVLLAASRICQTDHKNGGWLLMETQPIRKVSIFFAKYLVVLYLVAGCILSFLLSSYLLSAAWEVLFAQDERSWDFNVLFHLQTFLKLLLSSFGAAAFMLFVALSFSGYIWAMALGILGILLNFASLAYKTPYPFSPFYPEIAAFIASDVRDLTTFLGYSERLSFFWTVLFLGLGYTTYVHKSIKKALLRSPTAVMVSVVLFASFLGLYLWIDRPVLLTSQGQSTRIQGEVQAKNLPQSFQLTDAEVGNVVAEIPVKNGKFFWETTDSLPTGKYNLSSSDGVHQATDLLLGKGDYYHFHITKEIYNQNTYYKSNRKAENTLSQLSYKRTFNILALKFATDSHSFYKNLESTWFEALEDLDDFKTYENFGARDDFKVYKSQLLAIDFLDALAAFENSTKTTAPPALSTLLTKVLEVPTPMLLKDDTYLTYKINQVRKEVVEDSLLLEKIATTADPKLRDRLVHKQITTMLEGEDDPKIRAALLSSAQTYLANSKYSAEVDRVFRTLAASQKGEAFPDVLLEDELSKTLRISDLRDKYLVLSLWNEGCPTCVEKHKQLLETSSNNVFYKNIVFISLSLEENRERWKKALEGRNRANTLRELWLPLEQRNNRDWTTAPRIVVIDPQGKILHIDAPGPETQAFSKLIQRMRQAL